MITVKDHRTGRLFDLWDYLGPKRRKLLENSWVGVFRKYLFEKLPVGRVARHFTERVEGVVYGDWSIDSAAASRSQRSGGGTSAGIQY